MNPTPYQQLAQAQLLTAMVHAVGGLTADESELLTAKFGLGAFDGRETTLRELGHLHGVSREIIRRRVKKAHEKIRRSFPLGTDASDLATIAKSLEFAGYIPPIPSIQVQEVGATIERLTPELMAHLKRESSDISKVRWDVFEHIVAELLLSLGFEGVRLLGRNSETAADIFAAWRLGRTGLLTKYFVEVKRWEDRVGVEVVDRVYGAMLAERPNFGWHAAMIVSVSGFKEMKKYSIPRLQKLGIELKEKDHILEWLRDYQPHTNGLWLPARSGDRASATNEA